MKQSSASTDSEIHGTSFTEAKNALMSCAVNGKTDQCDLPVLRGPYGLHADGCGNYAAARTTVEDYSSLSTVDENNNDVVELDVSKMLLDMKVPRFGTASKPSVSVNHALNQDEDEDEECQYDAKASVESTYWMLQRWGREKLLRRGFPPYVVKKMDLAVRDGPRVRKKSGIKSERVQDDNKEVRKSFEARSQEGCNPASLRGRWVIPPGPPSPRPGVYNRLSFAAWCRSESRRLSVGLKKNQYVTGSQNCRLLYNGCNATEASKMWMMASATVYVASYTDNVFLPRPVILGDYFPEVPCLVIGSTICHAAEDLLVFNWKKNLSLLRNARDYFLSPNRDLKRSIERSAVVVEKQGAKVSVIHTVDPDIMELMTELIGDTALDALANVTAVSSFIVAVSTSRSWLNTLSIVTLFLSAHRFLRNSVALGLEFLKAKIQTYQGDGDSWLNADRGMVMSMWDVVVGSSVGVLLKDVGSELRTSVVDLVPALFRGSRAAIIKEMSNGIASSIMLGVTEVFNRVKCAVDARSIEPLIDGCNPEKWLRECNSRMTYFPILCAINSDSTHSKLTDLRRAKAISDDWVSPVSVAEFVARGEDFLGKLPEMIRIFSARTVIVTELKKAGKEFKSFLDMCRLHSFNGSERVEPVAISLEGPPGIGKSGIINTMANAIERKLSYSPEGRYTYSQGVNFQTGLDQRTWVVVADDCDNNPLTINDVGNFLVNIINTKPMPVEAAAVDEKGTISTAPTLLIYATNHGVQYVAKQLLEPIAILRRFKFQMSVCVKGEYALPDGRLDKEKALASGTHDMWLFSVHEFDSTVKGTGKGSPKLLTFSQVVTLVTETIIAEQTAGIERLKNLESNGGCPTCGLSTAKTCGCPTVSAEMQGAIQVKGPRGEFMDLESESHSEDEDDDDELIDQPWWFSLPRALGLVKTRVFRKEYYFMMKPYLVAGGLLAAGLVAVKMLHKSLTVTGVLQARENNLTPGMLPPSWTRAVQDVTLGKPPSFPSCTFTKDDLVRDITRNHCMVRNSTGETMHALQLSVGVLLLPSHALMEQKTRTLYPYVDVMFPNVTTRVTLSVDVLRVFASDREVCLLSCPNSPPCVDLTKKMWLDRDVGIQQFDSVNIVGAKIEYTPSKNQMMMWSGHPVISTNAQTVSGDCGLAYIAQFGDHWRLVGIHYMLIISNGVASSCAGVVTSLECGVSSRSLGIKIQGAVPVLSSVSTNILPLDFQDLSHKSELWASLDGKKPIFVYGRLNPPLGGVTMRTKVRRTPNASIFLDLEKEVCGCNDYWRLPRMVGHMADDVWVSPYTEAMSSVNSAILDPKLLAVAVADYVSGAHLLYLDGFRISTEEECLSGDSGYVNPVNMKTGMGPPFNVNKSRHIHVDRSAGSYADPKVWAISDEIQRVWDQGDIPMVLTNDTLKDEPVKMEKVPRVFCVPCAAAELKGKSVTAPIKAFMRSNMGYFECAVGSDMGSLSCGMIPDRLLRQGREDEPIFYGTDVSRMDKSVSFDQIEACARTFGYIGFLLGTKWVEPYTYVKSTGMVMHNVKGDLAIFPANPSGSTITVEENSTVMSICERIQFYGENPWALAGIDVDECVKWYKDLVFQPRIPPEGKYVFRDHVTAWFYGDDSLFSTRIPLKEGHFKRYQERTGMVVTSDDKGPVEQVPKGRTLKEVSFLKRYFHRDGDLWKASLSTKSLVRSLMMKKESTLSTVDYMAISNYEVMRESFLHGKTFYDRMVDLCSKAAKEFGYETNPYFKVFPYDHWQAQYVSGEFRSWNERSALPYFEFQGDSLRQEDRDSNKQLNNLTMSEINSFVKPNSSLVADSASKTAEEIAFVTGATGVNPENLSRDVPQPAGWRPKRMGDDVSLTQILSRGCLISESTFNGANTVGQNVFSFQPIAQLNNNVMMVDKLRNAEYMRFDFVQVIAVVTGPAGIGGRYVMSAHPRGGPLQNTINEDATFVTCMGVDHYAELDMASCNTGVLQLPWCWQNSCADVESSVFEGSWIVNVWCVAPVASGVGTNVAVDVKIYANYINPELIVTSYQGKKKKELVANPTLSRFQNTGVVSSVAKDVSGVAGMLAQVPVIGAFAKPVQIVADVVGGIASAFGFTRVSEPRNPMPMTVRTVTNVALTDGKDSSDIAALSEGNQISCDPTLSCGIAADQSSLPSICDRWSLVSTFTWTSAQPEKTQLLSLPVSPFFGIGTFASGRAEIHLGGAGYFGLPMNSWRGNARYLFTLPVTKFTTGRLQFFWQPSPTVSAEDPTNLTRNYIHDVSQGDIELCVGFSRDKGYCLSALTTAGTLVKLTDSFNGYLFVNVLAPLSSQTASSTLQVAVWAKWEDMQYCTPRNYVSFTNGTGTALTTYSIEDQVIFQGQGAIGWSDEDKNICVDLVPFAAPLDPSLHCGEEILSGRALSQKPSKMNAISLPNGYFNMPWPVPPPQPGQVSGMDTKWTWFAHIAVLFVGVAGSCRVKLFSNSDLTVGASRVSGPEWDGFTYPTKPNPGIVAPMTVTSSGGAEVLVPYYSTALYTPTSGPGFDYIKLEAFSNKTGVTPQVVPYLSAGPDVRFGTFTQVPKIIFRTAVPGSFIQWLTPIA